MLAASCAELAQFEAIRIILLVLFRGIVAALAGCASQRDHDAILFAFTSHDILRYVAWLAEDLLDRSTWKQYGRNMHCC
jgi:hypothetical protein